MDKAKILQLCNQIEMIIVTVCDTGYTLQPGDEEAIFNRTKAIMDEVSAPPKSNADRIRQMTDEELAKFIVTQMIRGAIQANNIYDIERVKFIENSVINSACGKKDIETALNMLREDVNEDAGTD